MTGSAAASGGPLASPGYWLHHAALRWRSRLEVALAPLGLTTTQFVMLASIGWLEHEGTRPTQQQAADVAGSDRMMASRVIRTLEQAGFVERASDARDGRALRLALTDAGRRTAAAATGLARRTDLEVFGDEGHAWVDGLRGLAAPDGEPRRRSSGSPGARGV